MEMEKSQRSKGSVVDDGGMEVAEELASFQCRQKSTRLNGEPGQTWAWAATLTLYTEQEEGLTAR